MVKLRGVFQIRGGSMAEPQEDHVEGNNVEGGGEGTTFGGYRLKTNLTVKSARPWKRGSN